MRLEDLRTKTCHVPVNSTIWRLFSLYTVLLCLLPSGSVYGVNVKIVFFVPLILIAGHRLAKEKSAFADYTFAALCCFVVTVMVLRSSLNPFYAELALSQAKDILTTLAGCLLIRIFTPTRLDREKFIRLCIYAAFIGSALKLLLILYSMVTGASVGDIVDRISAIFGVKLMAMDLESVGGRLQLPSDNLLPIALFALIGLRKRLKIHSSMATLFVALLLFSSFYTFSRFIWASTLLAALLGVLIAGRDKLLLIYLSLCAGTVAYFFPIISVIVTLRFSEALAGTSDMIRIWQIAALKEFFWNAPLFGHGIGSYVLNLKRSLDVPYAYEVQILALFGQFGIIGVSLFIFLLINYYRKAFDFGAGRRFYQISLIILLLDFLASALFNPILLTSMSALSYGLIFVMALIDPRRRGEC